MENKNALAELADELVVVRYIANRFRTRDTKLGAVVHKAQRIVEALAKEFEPIDPDSVKPSDDGRKHLADFIKAGDKRRCDIMIKCYTIAEEGK